MLIAALIVAAAPALELPALPAAVTKGRGCWNNVWHDFIPGADVALAKKLIETESIEVTAAFRQWDKHDYREVQLAKHAAVVLRSGEDLRDRTVWLVPAESGVLIIQAMGRGDPPEKGVDCVPLQEQGAAKLVEFFFAPAVQQKAAQLSKTTKPPEPKKLAPFPHDLDEALAMLEQKLDAKALAEIRASKSVDDLSQYHFGLGMGIRNGWGLWGDSPLARYFHAMGVHHPDDMSGIILDSFWRKQHGQPLEVEKQAAFYQRYWAVRRPPAELKTCANGKPAKALFELEDGDTRVLHLYSCEAAKLWAYELDAGWYEPDEKVRKRVKQLEKDKHLSSAPLEEPGK